MILEESWGALGAWTAGVGIELSFLADVVRGGSGRRKEGGRRRRRKKIVVISRKTEWVTE